jgi:hypothetical protein
LRAEVYLPPSSYRDAQRRSLYVEQSLRALEALPGIEAVAAARIVPFTDSTRMGGRLKFPDNGEETQAGFHWNAVTQDYFRAMGIPILQGRAFTHADRGGHKVVVVNRSFVERHLHGRPPIGCVFMWGPEGGSPHEVVGVVGATKNLTLGEVGEPQLYQFLPQIGNERQRIQFVMRSRTPPATQLDAVRRTLRDQEPGAGTQVATLASSIGLAFLPSQVGAALLSAIGGLGLLLASIGLSGVLAYSIACRTREIAIRIAVGAARRDIVRMVLRDSGRLLCVGSALGLFAAVFVTEPLAMFLVPGLEPRDPATFAAVFLVLFLTGVAASLGPIRRAVTVDPIASLRSE